MKFINSALTIILATTAIQVTEESKEECIKDNMELKQHEIYDDSYNDLLRCEYSGSDHTSIITLLRVHLN